MERTAALLVLVLILGSCTTTRPLVFRVTPMGDPPEEPAQVIMYGLPETLLKIDVEYREVLSIPGPYWEYAGRYLGIEEIIRRRSDRWEITAIHVQPFEEVDPEQFYVLRVEEGDFSSSIMDPFIRSGSILTGQELNQLEITGLQRKGREAMVNAGYVDLGVESNFAERSETMMKTIVTDTSFVEVPVQRTVVEQKSAVRKAEEAADFLLELRTRRFDMLTGEYESFPDGEAMASAIQKLDELEASYLSLFTGKTITRSWKKTFFVEPESGTGPGRYRLGMFSENLGFVPEGLMEGEALEVILDPQRKVRLPERYFAGDVQLSNTLYYRIPDVVELRITRGDELLNEQRISIYQSGALVGIPLR